MRRNESSATQYTAFALVAIESLWPNPEGNELAPDPHDLAAVNLTSKPQKSPARDGFRPPKGVDERGYLGNVGYYKVLPLNVLNVETSSSVGSGTKFSVTFSLSDLVLTIPKGSESTFRNATGLPVSTDDLVSSDLNEPFMSLPQLINSDEKNWEYIKDSDLGMSRYRISGPYSSFNVEDLVEINDTVTIWIYHDPSDFYIKDDVTLGDHIKTTSNEITGIVGSADRQNQFSSDTMDFDESFLFNLGLVSDTITQAVSYEGDVSQISPVGPENISSILTLLTGEAASEGISSRELISEYIGVAFRDEADVIQDSITDLVFIYSSYAGVEGAVANDEVHKMQEAVRRSKVDEEGNFLPLEGEDLLLLDNKYMDVKGEEGAENLAILLNILKSAVNRKAQNYAEQYLVRRKVTESSEVFTNGRKILLNGAHGETPYLAVKGMISNITTSPGAAGDSHTVTISGEGYEKVLNDNEVFFDNYLTRENIYTPEVEHFALYMWMTPSRAVRHIISRWAARQVLIGKVSPLARQSVDTFFKIRKPEAEEGAFRPYLEDSNYVKDSIVTGSEERVIRGNVVYSSNLIDDVGMTLEEVESSFGVSDYLRVFSPVNYLDTTRVQEMSNAMDLAFQHTSTEAVIRTSVYLQSKTSIMQNLRNVAGAGEVYEMFTDETGRFRYRLRFEALERTPRPGLTPTVQDYDLLAAGSSFTTTDTELSTLVDVKPADEGQSGVTLGQNAYVGRGTYEEGGLPIDGNDQIPDHMISPELYRYGMKHLLISDLYQDEVRGARRKALLYHGFFGHPLKKATLRLKNNTSYRIGETVLVALQRNKRRSKALIDLERMIEWMEFLLKDENQTEREMYIGVEDRFLQEGKGAFTITSSDDAFLPIHAERVYQKFIEDPHKFIAQQFLDTFKYLQDTLEGVNVITPEYFPVSYWYYNQLTGTFRNWDQAELEDHDIIDLHSHALKSAVLGEASAANKIEELLHQKEDAQGIINSVRFQNFRAASYYIEGVSHRFAHGAEATSVISLNFGQDTLVLLEPKNMLPVGFLSLEKKLKIGYPSNTQSIMYNDPDAGAKDYSYSTLQNTYIEQFKQDKKFKEVSFLHQAQYLRNSSNYMHEIVNYYDPSDSALELLSGAGSAGIDNKTITPSRSRAPEPYVTGDDIFTINPSTGDTKKFTRKTVTETIDDLNITRPITHEELLYVEDVEKYDIALAELKRRAAVLGADEFIDFIVPSYEAAEKERGDVPTASGLIESVRTIFTDNPYQSRLLDGIEDHVDSVYRRQ